MAGCAQKDTDYVDDISTVSTDPNDVVLLDEAFTLFEKVSGTVLNCSNKSKIRVLEVGKRETLGHFFWLS